MGRLWYKGEETTLTWNDLSDRSGGNPNNRFYFTNSDDNSRWREVFFVTRVRGKKRGSSTIENINSTNTVIANSGNTMTIPEQVMIF